MEGKKKNLFKRLIMVTGPAKPDHHKHFLPLCNKQKLKQVSATLLQG